MDISRVIHFQPIFSTYQNDQVHDVQCGSRQSLAMSVNRVVVCHLLYIIDGNFFLELPLNLSLMQKGKVMHVFGHQHQQLSYTRIYN